MLCRLAAEEAQNRETPHSTSRQDALVAAAALALADHTQASVVRKPVAGVDAVTQDANASGSLPAGSLPADRCPKVRQVLTGGTAAKATGAELKVGKQQPQRPSEPEAAASRSKQPAAKRHKASFANPARGEMLLCIGGQSRDTGSVHAT